MAGHNKWSKIRHRKAVVDSRRSKVWSKCAKIIMVAAKHGGGDPDSNLALRYAIDEARYANMPRDTIARAVKKGTGELGNEDWVEVRYEGYGPGGLAVVVDALTNNRTRTATEVRNAFAKVGGNLGTTGCVGYLFNTVGHILIDPSIKGFQGDKLMEAAIDAGASDVIEGSIAKGDDDESTPWIIATEPADFHAVRQKIEAAGFTIDEASIRLIPTTHVTLRGDAAASALKLIDLLENDDDVQKVYSNLEIPDDELAALE